MKFIAALAFAGAVTAVAIPRDTTISISVDSTLSQLNNLLNEIKPAVSNLTNEANAANLDLSSLQTQLSDIQFQLRALVPSSSKREILQDTTSTVGNTLNTVDTVAAPVTDDVSPAIWGESSITKRDTGSSVLSNPVSTVSQLATLASNFCSGMENNVPLSESVNQLTILTQGISVYLQLPLSLIQLPSSI
ncbi:hypothetical protein UA08_02403 [Talaromyces atroroseus]|uniref:Cell wall protein n=1 Tax=Talaromyces atroroseus TaxID=1441469 RepID=A0A225B7Y3_TALAT|nr:hypothetical protein UA08_02403 [Talaromyces atroroseus]OKL62047.1 hypothetical protein UA08_02403 [Talaromyces atroroseus]